MVGAFLRKVKQSKGALILVAVLVSACEDQQWNNPYPYENPKSRTLYSAFSERPKHLDPAISYTTSEAPILSQIYEPPLQYHYLKRPYVLEPLTAETLPEVKYYNSEGKSLAENADKNEVAYSEYLITIKPGILFQAHPAFVKDEALKYRYLNLSEKEASQYHTLNDFKETATRELIADDYVYQIKRLAEPSLNSPIYGLMSQYIVGLSELRQKLILERQKRQVDIKQGDINQERADRADLEMDLRPFSLEGAQAVDRYRYLIRIKGKYPQFRFWLAMNFFAPVPSEVALFYAQAGLKKHNISLDWYPVGTGPFKLDENNPDRRMVLIKNDNFREEFFPTLSPELSHTNASSSSINTNLDSEILTDVGKKLPLIDKVIFSLEKESIPFWNKFLQGYYDISAIASDNFNSAIRLNSEGKLVVTDELQKKDIRLSTSVSPNLFYWGFNMLDPKLGGDSLQARKLRQAISLAFDIEEFISIFLNGRGVLAKGPIPPDIFGYETQLTEDPSNNMAINISSESKKSTSKMNVKTTENNEVTTNHKATRTNAIAKAKKLLKEAGYDKGLTIYLDTIASGDPDEIALNAWLKEQFNKIGLQLVIRGAQYNRFQDKIEQGNTQMFFYGWSADYPDPENFLFMFYGPHSAVLSSGENKTNYQNAEYDSLFERMRVLDDGPERLAIIADMIKILQRDAPAVWGFYPKSFALYQGWTRVTKPSNIINNTLKYFNIYPETRASKQHAWNKPLLWPLYGLFVLVAISIILAFLWYWLGQTKHKVRK